MKLPNPAEASGKSTEISLIIWVVGAVKHFLCLFLF